ncbi:hypothetical protein LV79_006175 [Actinokineospora globicatena]|nr:hypothetical protein [Actinokineospora globicatena]
MRADLVALSAEVLGALASRGLVKRAVREVEAGAGPELAVGADGGVRGVFGDGVETVLAVGVPLGATVCSCGAVGVCRHRVAVVVAYQRAQAAVVVAPWSPAVFSDDDLVDRFGQRVLAAARRTWRAGLPVRVRRATAADPVPAVELPSCTVRFLVAGELAYADTDAVASYRGEAVVLAVWAFRAADERDPSTEDVRFDVGGAGSAAPVDITAATELAATVLLDGAANASPVLIGSLRAVRDDLTSANLHWPAAATDELVEQLAAYQARGAQHRVERVAELITEVHARARATGDRSRVLGVEEIAETRLRQVRLTALGARVRGTVDSRTVDIYFHDARDVLVLREHMSGETRLHGVTPRELATSTVLSESVVRGPSRVIRLARGGAAKTSIIPSGHSWSDLSTVVSNYAAAVTALRAAPPRVLRPRVAAESVRVLRIAQVEHVGYHPGAQRLEAVITDPDGTAALVSAEHRGVAPGALDALARALADEPTYVSGAVSQADGELRIDPIAVFTAHGLVVPDLAPADAPARLEQATSPQPDHLTAVLTEAQSLCAEAAHRGLRHLSPAFRDRLPTTTARLREAGLHPTADAMAAFARTPAVDTWLPLHLRLLIALELK